VSCVCGENDPEKMMSRGNARKSKTLCKLCHNQQTIARGRENRKQYLLYKGGKCERCGYKACQDALEFHHQNPKEKDPTFKSVRYWGFEKAKFELDKCLLLCSNCHREKHAGIW
jgi:predicted Zn-ribbon and HTH transcriptional regulator